MRQNVSFHTKYLKKFLEREGTAPSKAPPPSAPMAPRLRAFDVFWRGSLSAVLRRWGRRRLWTVRGYLRNDVPVATTLPLQVLTHAKKLCSRLLSTEVEFYWQKHQNRVEPPFGGLRGNVHCSSMARWKARDRLPISDNWTFCHLSRPWADIDRNRCVRKGWVVNAFFAGRGPAYSGPQHWSRPIVNWSNGTAQGEGI